jgi:hypothetical protein
VGGYDTSFNNVANFNLRITVRPERPENETFAQEQKPGYLQERLYGREVNVLIKD